jgi:hypothetical protein
MRDIADLRHILSSSIDCIDDVLPPRTTEGEKVEGRRQGRSSRGAQGHTEASRNNLHRPQ